MTLDLATIVQTAGPGAVTLLLAYLWKAERDDHKETRAKLDSLTTEILRKAGAI